MTLFDFYPEREERIRSIADVEERIRVRNEWVRRRFEEDIAAAGWKLLRLNAIFTPAPGERSIVVGVVLWSSDDLSVLGHLVTHRPIGEVYVFNLDDVNSPEQLEAFAPGVPLPTKTPIVAIYEGGALASWGAGRNARDLLVS